MIVHNTIDNFARCIECLLISNPKKTSLHNSIECIIHQTNFYKEKNRWHSKITYAQNIGLHGRHETKEKTLLLNPIIIWYNFFFLQMLQTYTATSKERGYKTKKKSQKKNDTRERQRQCFNRVCVCAARNRTHFILICFIIV